MEVVLGDVGRNPDCRANTNTELCHGHNAPPTTDNGSAVIDGIWATPANEIERGGYLAGGEAIPRTNHQCLWMDVTYETLYGHAIPLTVRYSIR